MARPKGVKEEGRCPDWMAERPGRTDPPRIDMLAVVHARQEATGEDCSCKYSCLFSRVAEGLHLRT